MLLLRRSANFRLRCLSTAAFTFYDIVIVGGGSVGNAMACSIGVNPRLKNLKVLLLEAGEPKSLSISPPEVFGSRVFAVNPTSVELFRKIDIWNRLKDYRAHTVSQLLVMDSCSQSTIRFDQPSNNTPIAHMIEDEAIGAALYDRVHETDVASNVTLRTRCKVEKIDFPTDLSKQARLVLSDGSVVETLLVVGADGAKSNVRTAMGVNYSSWDYGQSAIVCTLDVDSNYLDTIAWQRFSTVGPIALLPLGKNFYSLVWTTSHAEADSLMKTSDDMFVRRLNYFLTTNSFQNSVTNKALFAMDTLLSKVPLVGGEGATKLAYKSPVVRRVQAGSKRVAFPLSFIACEDYVNTRAALIGDAAHRLHPLSGQGVNLGWYDVTALTDALLTAVADGGDIGSITYLRDFDTNSQRHNVPIMLTVDALKRLYSTEFGPLVFLRSVGLHTLDKMLPIKDYIIHKASW